MRSALALLILPALALALVEYQPCGSRGLDPCAEGLTCIDDPRQPSPCTTASDCPGICVGLDTNPRCAGFTGAGCGGATACFDLPSDNCDPDEGGSDCEGICLEKLE